MDRNSIVSIGKLKGNKRKNIVIFISVLFFSLSLVLGYQLQFDGHTFRHASGKVIVLLISLGIEIVLFPLFYWLFSMVEKKRVSFESRSCLKYKQINVFLLLWLLIFLSWIPIFLAYYPCVMSSDFDIQLYQVTQGHTAFTNHHPYLSTLEIEFFYNLKNVFGTVRKGMAALGIWHIFVLSSAFSILCTCIYRITGKMLITFISVALIIIYPVNPVLGLSTTKDVMFSSTFLWFMCLLIYRFYFADNRNKKNLYELGIVLSGLLMCSFRNNAVYALLVSGIFAVMFASRKEKVKIAVMVVLIITLHLLSQKGLERYLGVTSKVETPEMHSVIIQCFGRAYCYNEEKLSGEEKEIIEKYIPKDYIHLYNPSLSDPLKTAVTNYTFDSNWRGQMGKVISDWIKIGIHYPNEYFDAFLDLTRGYWYPYDTSYATVWGADLKNRMGLLYTNNTSGYYGVDEIWHESKLPKLELVYEKILSRNDFFNWPILNHFFRLSFYVWIMLFSFVYWIMKRERKKILVMQLPFFYFLTLLLGPTAYIRYIYPIMITTPLMITLLFVNFNLEEGKQHNLKSE